MNGLDGKCSWQLILFKHSLYGSMRSGSNKLPRSANFPRWFLLMLSCEYVHSCKHLVSCMLFGLAFFFPFFFILSTRKLYSCASDEGLNQKSKRKWDLIIIIRYCLLCRSHMDLCTKPNSKLDIIPNVNHTQKLLMRWWFSYPIKYKLFYKMVYGHKSSFTFSVLCFISSTHF
jgi:hypothetical protein